VAKNYPQTLYSVHIVEGANSRKYTSVPLSHYCYCSEHDFILRYTEIEPFVVIIEWLGRKIPWKIEEARLLKYLRRELPEWKYERYIAVLRRYEDLYQAGLGAWEGELEVYLRGGWQIVLASPLQGISVYVWMLLIRKYKPDCWWNIFMPISR